MTETLVTGLRLYDATIRVREKENCPGITVAETVADLTDSSEVRLKFSESSYRGWRRTIIHVPELVYKEDLKCLDEYPLFLANSKVVNTSDSSWIVLDIKDKALNGIFKMQGIFQRVVDYRATVGYEDFRIWIYPRDSLKKVAQSLNDFGNVYTIRKEVKPFEDMPTFAFQGKSYPVLTNEEKNILELAFKRGFFETPRPNEAKMAALAKELGIGTGRLSERLRHIMRKMSREYFDTFLKPF